MPWNQSNNGKDLRERDKRQSPPDLDAVINKFLSSFGGILGSKNTNNGKAAAEKKEHQFFHYLSLRLFNMGCNWFFIS